MMTATTGRTLYILPSNVATSLSPNYKEIGHFTLLFCRGRQRNAPRYKTHVHSHCSVHLTFSLVSLSSPSPSWFAKTPYCSVRDWTRFLRHRIKKYPDSPVPTLSDSLRIYFFPLWRAYLFFSDSLSNSPDTCGR